MNNRRVVVTGVGAITSVGNDVSEIWDSLIHGKTGIGKVTRFDTEDYPSQIAGEIKSFDIHKTISPKEAKRLDPFSQYAVVAADEAVKQSKLDFSSIDALRVGVVVGSGVGGIITLEKQLRRDVRYGPSRV